MENKFAGVNDEIRKATLLQAGFTDKSVSALQALIGYSAEIRKWEDDMDAVGDTTKDVSDNVLTDFDKAWNKVTASMGLAASEGFAPILDQLATMIDRTGSASSGIKGLADATDRWSKIGADVAKTMGDLDEFFKATTGSAERLGP